MIRAYRLTNKAVVILFAAMAMLLMAAAFTGPQAQAQANPEAPTEKVLVVKGQVKEVSPATKSLVVKPKKGASVPITLSSQTTFEGFSRLEDLAPKQPVQVWYYSNGQSNIAVKIERLPELGC